MQTIHPLEFCIYNILNYSFVAVIEILMVKNLCTFKCTIVHIYLRYLVNYLRIAKCLAQFRQQRNSYLLTQINILFGKTLKKQK